MARWYLQGELSDPAPDLERDLAAIGVGWKVVPTTGHAMGLQNPSGFATAVAEGSARGVASLTQSRPVNVDRLAIDAIGTRA